MLWPWFLTGKAWNTPFSSGHGVVFALIGEVQVSGHLVHKRWWDGSTLFLRTDTEVAKEVFI